MVAPDIVRLKPQWLATLSNEGGTPPADQPPHQMVLAPHDQGDKIASASSIRSASRSSVPATRGI
jgi:hypothetical protein